MEATITPDNVASRKAFESVARVHNGAVELEKNWFKESDFPKSPPGEAPHEPEVR